jgi:hypothetical protein
MGLAPPAGVEKTEELTYGTTALYQAFDQGPLHRHFSNVTLIFNFT